ncbi:MAG: hypothetical protein C0622_00230 [Desulfuromonas sp.]|nr:MAG: hypothetical protein C0622_00230 [Desulfuromonas sp.]
MKKTYLMILLSCALILGASAVCFAADKSNVSDKTGASAAGQGVSSAALASELAAYARANDNAQAMLVAAEILRNAAAVDVDLDKGVEGDATAAAEKASGALATRDAMLAEAEEMAGDDVQLLAMIDAEKQAQGTKGDITGPNEHRDRVNPRATDVYEITFRGDELAEVAVLGDGDNDLDLFIYDENGNLIESDEDATDQCYVSWYPAWTGTFKIKIKNLGRSVYSNYVLLTN